MNRPSSDSNAESLRPSSNWSSAENIDADINPPAQDARAANLADSELVNSKLRQTEILNSSVVNDNLVNAEVVEDAASDLVPSEAVESDVVFASDVVETDVVETDVIETDVVETTLETETIETVAVETESEAEAVQPNSEKSTDDSHLIDSEVLNECLRATQLYESQTAETLAPQSKSTERPPVVTPPIEHPANSDSAASGIDAAVETDDEGIVTGELRERTTNRHGRHRQQGSSLTAEDESVFVGVPVSPPVRILDSKPVPPAPKPALLVRSWRFVGSTVQWMFGVVCLLVGLAVVSSIPIVQFASLGYLLEASGRVSRSGRIRDGFMGVRAAARVGGLVLGAWLMYAPLLLINEFWYSAYLIDPGSWITNTWRVVQLLATGLCVAHVVVAWFCGGRLRDYFWPFAAPIMAPINWYRGKGFVASIPPLRLLRELFQGGLLARRRDAVWDFVVSLRLPHLFWLGLRGFAGAVAWLFLPILLLVAASFMAPGPAVLFSLLGAALLTVVLLYLPFLQAHFAAEGEMVAMFDLGAVRKKFRKAPIAFWFSLLITLLFAVPLYLLKIELTPSEMLWIPSLVFVAFMFPARILAGWVLGLATRREAPRHFIFRLFSRIAQVPIVLAYVGIVYLTQYLSWYGVWSLFEQHAFLTPAPFLGG